MSYATITDLEAAYSVALFGRLCVRTDDPDPVPGPTIILRQQAALDEAAGVMDGYFQPSYSVPVMTSVPSGLSSLRGCCCVLAVAVLVGQKGYVRGSEDESLILRAEVWRSWLRDVSAGKVQIPGASATDASNAGSAPRKDHFVMSKRHAIHDLDRRYR